MAKTVLDLSEIVLDAARERGWFPLISPSTPKAAVAFLVRQLDSAEKFAKEQHCEEFDPEVSPGCCEHVINAVAELESELESVKKAWYTDTQLLEGREKEAVKNDEENAELEKRAEKAEAERDEWREKAWDLPMAAKKSGYEDGKMEALAHIVELKKYAGFLMSCIRSGEQTEMTFEQFQEQGV